VGNERNVFGNADLNAESTVQYEIGIQSQLFRGFGLDATVFYKDIRDWVGISPLIDTKHSQLTRYTQYENKDYANVRGITVALEARPSNEFTAMIDYTYQVAEGTYSSPNDAYNALDQNEEPALKLIYMDYDRRHSVNAIFTYQPPTWVISLIGIFNTGFPYTPDWVAGSPDSQYRGWRENIARKPSYSQIDLRVDKVLFETGPLSHRLFLRVFNLFDQRGELNVHRDTGTAEYTTLGTHSWVRYDQDRLGSLEHFYLKPEWYQQPREIQLGYILNF
jgi:outer membrane receptor protein involved in Fe transport